MTRIFRTLLLSIAALALPGATACSPSNGGPGSTSPDATSGKGKAHRRAGPERRVADPLP